MSIHLILVCDWCSRLGPNAPSRTTSKEMLRDQGSFWGWFVQDELGRDYCSQECRRAADHKRATAIAPTPPGEAV